jgi:hypothetical protein
MRKFLYTVLIAAFIASVCVDYPAMAARAGTAPMSATQSTIGATKAKLPTVRPARVRRPAVRARAVPSNEQGRTAELNRQSLQNLQSPAVEARAAPTQDDPPLNHRLPESLERFDNANTMTKEGWTSTLGLLPQPETKVSIPSPDVRLQERGIHLGAMYRF